MDYFNCPHCGALINSEGLCPSCNEPLIDADKEIEETPTEPSISTEATKEYGGIRRLGYFLGMFGLGGLNYMFELTDDPVIAPFGSLIVLVLSFFLVVNRLHNIGLSGWWSLLMLVPVANLLVGIRCGICPEGYRDTKKLDTAGRVLAGIFIAFGVLVVIMLGFLFFDSYYIR
ncbi:MAG: DUF805 domain-containing protein [Planctomycetes bacterium]|nr:DUF805 domain-containing protein [Planctomycetota bacterium]